MYWIEIEMVDREGAKLAEEQFIIRLKENICAELDVGTLHISDCVNHLRDITNGTLLRRELETNYPVGKGVVVRIHSKPGLFSKDQLQIVLTGKVIVRLDRFVEGSGDNESISLSELDSMLSKESDLANRNRYESILGLYSPTGWAEEAKAFVLNDPPGTGWASNTVHPILIGPAITELVWDTRSEKLSKYVQYFWGLTLEERKKTCQDEIHRAILVQEFANLEKIAQRRGFDLDFVKRIAKELASGSKELSVARVSGVGWVLKKKI
jgi:hypothetical protein